MSYPPGAAQNLPHTFRCSNHPEREGVGICVSCRSVVCVECSTRVDRMNYCIRCLRAATEPVQEAKRDDRARDTLLGIPLLIGAFLAAAALFAAMGYLLAVLRYASPGGVSGG